MLNGEPNPTNPNTAAPDGEATGNQDRTQSRKRGEMTVKAEREARFKEMIERYAKLKAEDEELKASIAAKEKRIAELDAELGSSAASSEAASSEADTTATADASVEASSEATEVDFPLEPTATTMPEAEWAIPPDQVLPPDPTASNTNAIPAQNQNDQPDQSATSNEVIAEIEPIEDKAKKNRGFKKFIISAGAAILAAGIAISAGIAGRNKKNQPTPPPANTAVETMTEADTDGEDVIEIYENMEAEKGIKDGYGEKGMWLSDAKPSAHAFASAAEVAEVCNNNEIEMIKYTARNQVESFADYLANLPEQLQPEGFKGLSILETEKRLESLSDEEYDQTLQGFGQTMDGALVRHVVLNGDFQNALMNQKNEVDILTHNDMEVVECTTTENNIEVTQFFWKDVNGNEIGSMTVKIIYNEDGSIGGCEQVVNKKGSKPHLYEKLETIHDPEIHDDDGTGSEGTGSEKTGAEGTGSEDTGSEDTGSEISGSEGTGSEGTGSEGTGSEITGSEGTGSEGTGSEGTGSESTGVEGTGNESTGTEGTGNEGTGSETTDVKDPAAEIANAGDHVDQRDIDNNITPPTNIEQDQANFDAIEQQRQADAARQAEADRQAAEQAAAQQRAAEEAEARRQQEAAAAAAQAQADAEAAARAEAERQAAAAAAQAAAEQAAAEQAAAAEAERQRAAEQAAREQAQREADAAAAAEAAAAAANADNTAAERANDFENGNF